MVNLMWIFVLSEYNWPIVTAIKIYYPGKSSIEKFKATINLSIRIDFSILDTLVVSVSELVNK